MTVFAILGAGAMGSAVAGRLVENGADVLTFIQGRSEATAARALAAGMKPVPAKDLARADIILSIVPPGQALGVAKFVRDITADAAEPPPFADLNAVSPSTMQEIASLFAGSRTPVLDGAIIGGPPVPGKAGPVIYMSGEGAARAGLLADHGLQLSQLDGPLGAASALKMCYAGINEGFVGLGTAILLAASRSGASASLKQELEASLPEFDRKLIRSIPDMYPKAYRWVAEMEEIAGFLGEDDPASLVFRGMAGIFERMAADVDGNRDLVAQLDAILGSDKPS